MKLCFCKWGIKWIPYYSKRTNHLSVSVSDWPKKVLEIEQISWWRNTTFVRCWAQISFYLNELTAYHECWMLAQKLKTWRIYQGYDGVIFSCFSTQTVLFNKNPDHPCFTRTRFWFSAVQSTEAIWIFSQASSSLKIYKSAFKLLVKNLLLGLDELDALILHSAITKRSGRQESQIRQPKIRAQFLKKNLKRKYMNF